MVANGKISVEATSAVRLIVDLQGYYTAGSPAAGGYVPMTTKRIVDTRSGIGLPEKKLTTGSTTTVNVAGLSAVPADASAVFLNFTVLNYGTADAWITPYASGTPYPGTSLNFGANDTSAMGAVVQLGDTGTSVGKMNVWFNSFSSASTADLLVDVVGYFTPSTNTGAFTPAATRMVSALTVPGNTTVVRQLAGLGGVPAAGSGITALAVNVQVTHGGASTAGNVHVWADDQTSSNSIVNYSNAMTASNFAVIRLGADGGVKIQNNGTDPVNVFLDLEGWYTSLSDTVVGGQDTTQRAIALQASATGGGAWVTYKYRLGTTGPFAAIPTGANGYLSTDSGQVASQPVTKSGSPLAFPKYTWDIKGTLGSSTSDALVQVEACYGQTSTDADDALVCSMPSNITYSPAGFSAANATTSVGPGTLSLLTGDYQISSTDASMSSSIDGLSIGRSLTTLAPAAANTTASGVFGPGWSADLSGPSAGEGDLTPIDQHTNGYLEFTDASGYNAYYTATSSTTAYPISFAGVGDNAGDGETVTMSSATKIAMADPDGTVTTWAKVGSAWQVAGITEPGSNTTTTYTYANGLVTRILAPAPAGVTCTSPDTIVGCRSLKLSYTTIGGASRLTSVSASIPLSSGANETPIEKYDYNASGQLIDAYDPRTPTLAAAYTYDSNGRLKTLTPALDLAHPNSPGINPWSFIYDGTGRLSKVSQTVPVTDAANPAASPTDTLATSTIVYGVSNAPIAGDLRPDLTSSSSTGTPTWGESSDLPISGDATAVFSPDHVPADTDPTKVADSDWQFSTIHYLDVQGREVNTATFGANDWLIDSTQYDANGDDTWDLSAGNRAQALNPTSATDSYVAAITSPDQTGLSASVQRANLLASTTVYNPLDPSEVTDTYGPTHPVTLSTGAVIHARTHTSTVYDEGAPYGDVDPATGAAFRLPTTVVTDPYNVGALAPTPPDASFPDASTTRTGYDAVGSMSGQSVKKSDGTTLTDTSGNPVPLTGWSLGQATTSTVQMGASASSADMTTTTVYDADGRTIQTRLPGDTGGTTPRATNTTYYTAAGTGACVSPLSAGLVCQTAPGGQPSTGKPLPTTTTTYDAWGNTLTTAQTYGTASGATVRTTTNTYDNAERLLTSATSVTNAPADNTDLPTVTVTYDPATGQVATKTTGTGTHAQTLTSLYNSVGALTSYTDATGNTTTTGYDIDGRPISQTDTKGTVQYTYDGSGEHRGVVTSEDIGTSTNSRFTATYDADGNLTQTYPGGTTATGSFDNAGNQTGLSYTNNGSTLAAFTQRFGTTNTGTDHIVAQTSTVNGNPYSSQAFTDDAAGRLTTVADTYNGTCTTRKYAFGDPTSDAADYFDSNRTSLTSYPASSGGDCSSSTTPTTTSYSYDQADRLTSDTTGGTTNTYAYDALGRTSTLPSGDAAGIGSHNAANGGPTGDLGIGYYSNDMVASQTQGTGTTAASIAFGLDPDQDRVSTQTTTTAAGTKTITNHYDDASDATAWTSTKKVDGTTATKRYVGGIDGGLDATVGDDGSVKLDLTNLHGDTVATITPDATSITSYHETTEYGAPRDPASAADDYGSLGAKKRSTDDLGGLTLMGVRLYNPTTGHFLSVDRIAGGNANAYTYPNDPIDRFDPTGLDTDEEDGSGNAYGYSPPADQNDGWGGGGGGGGGGSDVLIELEGMDLTEADVKAIARRIAHNNHSFTKHVIDEKEFPNIKTRAQYGHMIEKVMKNGMNERMANGSYKFYYEGKMVIYNPTTRGGGTAYAPKGDAFSHYLNFGNK
ncbi:beta strand repeat-containing protein [Nocardioides sp. Iso805N]|uniref:beta strand repeat-containing protein n=1 Tax=Nocardioides sp. Iso805N TaxID=1283287 RepID=UPI000375BDA3|nr:RHS repeat-associated core domain-containing protein [Nocardioides sp. Iso805N]